MVYISKYDLYIDADLVVYVECSRDYKDARKGKLYQLRPTLERTGYYRINYCKNGKKRHVPYHRLIAEAFLPNPSKKPTVDHINRNPLDNRIENLRWATSKEQADNTRSVERGLHKYGVRCCEDVKQYNHNYGLQRRAKQHACRIKSFTIPERAA